MLRLYTGDNMRFKRIYIEISNTCNLSCAFCIQNKRVSKMMNIEEFSHIIAEVRPYCDYVYLHVLGEPLSHPYLEQFLTICEQAHLEVILTTNGTLLQEKSSILQASSIRQLNISLHSFPHHEQPHYLEEIVVVAKELAKQQVHINYRLWSLSNGQLSEDTKKILDDILVIYGKTLEEDQIKRLTRIDLTEFIHLHFEDIFEWPSLDHPYVSDSGRCLGMKTMCGILSDGSVIPCCLDSKGDINLGNIFDIPFSKIITSPKAQQMVQAFSQNKVKEELCQHCSYRLRFSK